MYTLIIAVNLDLTEEIQVTTEDSKINKVRHSHILKEFESAL